MHNNRQPGRTKDRRLNIKAKQRGTSDATLLKASSEPILLGGNLREKRLYLVLRIESTYRSKNSLALWTFP